MLMTTFLQSHADHKLTMTSSCWIVMRRLRMTQVVRSMLLCARWWHLSQQVTPQEDKFSRDTFQANV